MHGALGLADALSVGMFLQTLLLALTARGLATSVEVSVTGYPEIVRAQLTIPEDLSILCGFAVGYEDADFAANRFNRPIYLRHYAKGPWYAAATVFATTGRIELGKCINWLILVAAFLGTLGAPFTHRVKAAELAAEHSVEGNARLEFVTAGAKTRAPHQVGNQCDVILVSHGRVFPLPEILTWNAPKSNHERRSRVVHQLYIPCIPLSSRRRRAPCKGA